MAKRITTTHTHTRHAQTKHANTKHILSKQSVFALTVTLLFAACAKEPVQQSKATPEPAAQTFSSSAYIYDRNGGGAITASGFLYDHDAAPLRAQSLIKN